MSGPRERLLEVAEALFYSEGFRAVGIDRIIEEAKVAKASFYAHFPSKDDLLLAVLEARDARYRQWLAERVDVLAPRPADRPLAVFDALAERFSAGNYRGCAFLNSMVEVANRNHAAHAAAQRHKRDVTRYLAGLLADSGVKNPDPLAEQMMLLMDGAVVTAVRDGSPGPAKQAKAIAAALLKNVKVKSRAKKSASRPM